MATLMVTIALIAVVVGPSLLTGQPLLIAVGAVLAGAILLGARRAATLARRH
ncbi:hypothetical protein EV385_5721 [Krasilnikovia cinnamomea]|uniref:Uncharacterized protein n=1 Tax=Krasilnikovia cinnamomea TaxID=349313 RepID=A0A4Q7ZRL2_9ACTN|nr:hypothetical protein [Krasilnikovia cinnamomea]RZU53787.1 hypothetical protein EV385_5721 [Krasilnikovia cinnamomea]